MKITRNRLFDLASSAVIGTFVSFAFACWLIDFAVLENKLDHQLFPRQVLVPGTFVMGLTLVCSALSWRGRRQLTIAGILGCLVWVVWLVLPRL